MYNPSEIISLTKLAITGQMPPKGNLEDADEIMGFGFGLIMDDRGQLKEPGAVNNALAHFIVRNEILREKNMTLQEEIALAVQREDHTLSDQIQSLKTIKRPGETFSTHELIETVKPDFVAREIGKLAVVAFRHHLPRVDAELRKAGFNTVVPDLREVGEFDPNSSQVQTRKLGYWAIYEFLALNLFSLQNRI